MAKKGKVIIRKDRCKGCYLCIRVCPADALKISLQAAASGVYTAEAIDGKCIACKGCYTVCPDMSIEIYAEDV